MFPDLDACRALCANVTNGASAAAILRSEAVRTAFQKRLESFAESSTGSSNCVRCLLLLDELPSLDGGEVTDKGSLNQRAVLDRRAALVEEMYSTRTMPHILRVDRT